MTRVIVILTMAFFLGNFSGNQEEIPFLWKGKIAVRQKKLPGPGSSATGEVITEWQLDVNWKETRKNDIRDKRGQLVGQLVKLEDNGSSWVGTTNGRFVDTMGEKVYSGSGEGPGPVISAGYIYYSLSENDPLKSVLPNGSYAFGSGSGQTQTFQETITSISYDPPSSFTLNSPAILGYYVSQLHVFFLPFGHIGGGPTLDGPTSAESIKATIERSASFIPQSLPVQWDMETRLLDEGRMHGGFSHSWLNNCLVNEAEWDISKVLEIQCSVEKPNKYWRPRAGNEKNTIDITAKIEKYANLKGKWKFTLFEVSQEKGYAMNKGDETDLDLEFLEGQSDFTPPEKTEDGWVIESTKTANSIMVTVQSLDYGAWGKIKAEVNVEGHWYECRAEDEKDYVTIPYDEDEDHIADMWEEHFGVLSQSEQADEDSEPESKQDGDGFSNYEEYRGFFVNGIWREWYFSPKRKDIFIYDENGMGVGYFTETDLMIHLIDKQEYDEDRVVNFNRGYGTIDSQDGQKGLYLCEEEMAIGTKGYVWPCVGTPNVVEKVVIDVLDEFMETVYAEKGTEGAFLQNYAATLAHELGHAVNMVHHGDEMWESANGYEIARRGGLWSGEIICVMRYSPPDKYLGSDNNVYEYPEEGSGSRTSYCSSSTGTGINAPGERIGPDGQPYPVAGNAEIRRSCRYNITLKGYNKWGN
jgi:hypothetical protein